MADPRVKFTSYHSDVYKSLLVVSILCTVLVALAWAASGRKAPGKPSGWWQDFRLTNQSRVGIRGFNGTLVFWQVWKSDIPRSDFLVRGWGPIRFVSGYG